MNGKERKPKKKQSKKPKKPTFEVGQVVMARWMYKKSDQVPRGGGRSLCGKWYKAEILEVDSARKVANVRYTLDKLEEKDVSFDVIKSI
eukprot:961739-Pleurochrysis_carterae.AAC.1